MLLLLIYLSNFHKKKNFFKFLAFPPPTLVKISIFLSWAIPSLKHFLSILGRTKTSNFWKCSRCDPAETILTIPSSFSEFSHIYTSTCGGGSGSEHFSHCEFWVFLKGFPPVPSWIFLCHEAPLPYLCQDASNPEHHPMARGLSLLFKVKNSPKSKNKGLGGIDFWLIVFKKHFPELWHPTPTGYHDGSQVHPSTWSTSTSHKRREKEEKRWGKMGEISK